MSTLSTTFQLVDEMSSKLSSIADSGDRAMSRLEKGTTDFNNAFSDTVTTASQTARSIEDINNYVDKYEKSVDRATEYTQFWNDALIEQERNIGISNEALSRLIQSGYEYEDALEEVNKQLNRSTDELDDYIDKTEEGIESSDSFGESTISAFDGIAGAIAGTGILVFLDKIKEKFLECTVAAETLETQAYKVSTVADMSVTTIDDISGQVLSLSNDIGEYADGLTDAAYQAISAGVDTANVFGFVADANKLAQGGFTDTTTAVDVLTTITNAYNLSASETSRVSDILITTQNKGKTTVAELASSIGNVIPIAATYNVGLENLSTSYAVLTSRGIATAESTTMIKAMLSELGDSGSEVAQILSNETGMSLSTLMEQGYSLGDTLDIILNSVDGNKNAFNELWSSTEAGVSAITLLNAGSEEFNSLMGEMETSTGAAAIAYNKMASTTEDAHEGMQVSAENLKKAIGMDLNPVLKDLYNVGADAFSWATDLVQEHPAITASITAITIGIGAFIAPLTILAFTSIPAVTTAISTMTVAMAANPLFLPLVAISGVVALTASIVTFSSVMNGAVDEYDTWTASTKRQYNELERLNSEYDATVDQFGATSKEASLLRYEINDLTDSFESNKKTLEQFKQECEESEKAFDEFMNSYQDKVNEIDNQKLDELSLINKLDELSGNSTIATDLLIKVNTEFDTNVNYDDFVKNKDQYIEAFKKKAEQQANELQYQQDLDAYAELLNQKAGVEKQFQEAHDNTIAQQNADAMNRMNKMSGYKTYEVESQALKDARKLEEELKLLLEDVTNSADDFLAKMEETRNAQMFDYEKVRTDQEIIDLLSSNIQTNLEALNTSYNEAFNSAKTSLDQAVGMFDTLSMKSETTIDDMANALQSQIDFFNQHEQNLDKFNDRIGTLGLTDEQVARAEETLKSLSGIDQAAYLDQLANGTDDQVENIINLLEQVNTSKNNMLDEQAKIQTDYDDKMNELIDSQKAFVDKLEMSDEMRAAIIETLDGITQGLDSEVPNTVSAIENASNLINNAFDNLAKKRNTSFNLDFGFNLPGLNGFATGTPSAPEGIALVGEEGPEIIDFKGGERVYNANETKDIIGNAGEMNFGVSLPVTSYSESVTTINNATENIKRISVEINGSGGITVDSSVSKQSMLEVMQQHLKPVLMSIINQEIFEEGDLNYDY